MAHDVVTVGSRCPTLLKVCPETSSFALLPQNFGIDQLIPPVPSAEATDKSRRTPVDSASAPEELIERVQIAPPPSWRRSRDLLAMAHYVPLVTVQRRLEAPVL